MPKVIIVGAGITGLSAARVLTDSGWQVRMLDKGQQPGGRFSTPWINNRMRLMDNGAQFLTTRDQAFAHRVAEWEQRGWVKSWCHGLPLITAAGLDRSSDGFPRFIGTHGMRHLAQHLAADFDLQTPATVTHIVYDQPGWSVTWVPGDALRGTARGEPVVEQADAVLLTQPVPQVLQLLVHAGLPIPHGIQKITYDPCFALLINVPQHPQQLLPDPGAVRIDDAVSPLMWVASARGRGLVNEGDILLLHARGEWSTAHLDHTTQQNAMELLHDAKSTLHRIGISRDLTHLHNEGHMWRFSRCISTFNAPFAQVDRPAPLLIAGDGFGDCPRVEGAWLSGRAAAIAICDALSA